MAPRVRVVVWIVTWALLAVVVRGVGKVTKCCPRDMILMIDMNTCMDYVGHDQNSRQSYALGMDDEDGGGGGDDEGDYDSATVDATHEGFDKAPTLFLANSSTIPWLVTRFGTKPNGVPPIPQSLATIYVYYSFSTFETAFRLRRVYPPRNYGHGTIVSTLRDYLIRKSNTRDKREYF